MDENKSAKLTLFGIIPLDIAIPILISLLSIMTALAAYKAAVIDSASFDRYFEAQSALNTSNSLYIEANQNIIHDQAIYDYFASNDFAGNKRLADYYFDLFSDELMAAYERDTAAFDEIYYEEVYRSAEDALNESDILFKEASHDSQRAVSYQLTVLIMAVGLSFAAWASLSGQEHRMRTLFASLSVTAFLIGLTQMLTIPGALA